MLCSTAREIVGYSCVLNFTGRVDRTIDGRCSPCGNTLLDNFPVSPLRLRSFNICKPRRPATFRLAFWVRQFPISAVLRISIERIPASWVGAELG
jgi:hypothetical protein